MACVAIVWENLTAHSLEELHYLIGGYFILSALSYLCALIGLRVKLAVGEELLVFFSLSCFHGQHRPVSPTAGALKDLVFNWICDVEYPLRG